MKRLNGKVALITGGGGGIGAETARLFVAEGARVVLADVQESALQSVVQEIGAEAASYIVTDVSDEKQMKHAVEAAVERYGRLDALFANAGTEGRIVPLVDYTLADFERVAYFTASWTPISDDPGQCFRGWRTPFQTDPGQGFTLKPDRRGARE